MITIKQPQTDQEWEVYYDLRYRILREPFDKPRGSEKNEGDATATHFALYENEKLMAVARLDSIDAEVCQARFVAVEQAVQGKGFGKQIMIALEEMGKAQGHALMLLHARDYAVDFYSKLGYTLVGPSYKLFDVLQHYQMEKKLS